jgi:hypothetical protein
MMDKAMETAEDAAEGASDKLKAMADE